MTIRLLIKKFFRSHRLLVCLCANHTFAEAWSRILQWAPTQYIDIVLVWCTCLKNDLTARVWVRCCATVGHLEILAVKTNLVCFCALSLACDHFVSQSTFAVLAILSIVFKFFAPWPPEYYTFLLGVFFHAASRVWVYVSLWLVPAKIRNLALVIFRAFLAFCFVWLADRFERPLICIPAIGFLDAIIVLVARLSVLVANTNHATVSWLALRGYRTWAAWIQIVSKIACVEALSLLLALLNLRSIIICTKTTLAQLRSLFRCISKLWSVEGRRWPS